MFFAFFVDPFVSHAYHVVPNKTVLNQRKRRYFGHNNTRTSSKEASLLQTHKTTLLWQAQI